MSRGTELIATVKLKRRALLLLFCACLLLLLATLYYLAVAPVSVASKAQAQSFKDTKIRRPVKTIAATAVNSLDFALSRDCGCGNFSAIRSAIGQPRPLLCTHGLGDHISRTLHRQGYWEDCLWATYWLLVASWQYRPDATTPFQSAPRRKIPASTLHAERLYVLDVGANIGACTVPLSTGPVGFWDHVVAIEPTQLHSRVLRQSIAANKLHHMARVVSAAAWHTSGVRKVVYVEPSNMGNAVMLDNAVLSDAQWSASGGHAAYSEEVVTTTTIADELQRLVVQHPHVQARVPLLKLDVQGAEHSALVGAGRWITEQRVDVVFLEVEPKLTVATGHRPGEDLRLLIRHGYTILKFSSSKGSTSWAEVTESTLPELIRGSIVQPRNVVAVSRTTMAFLKSRDFDLQAPQPLGDLDVLDLLSRLM